MGTEHIGQLDLNVFFFYQCATIESIFIRNKPQRQSVKLYITINLQKFVKKKMQCFET